MAALALLASFAVGTVAVVIGTLTALGRIVLETEGSAIVTAVVMAVTGFMLVTLAVAIGWSEIRRALR